MASISHRTRSRRSESSVSTARRCHHAAAPPPIIVIDDADDYEIKEEESRFNLRMKNRVRNNNGKKSRKEDSVMSWDRKAVALDSNFWVENRDSEESVNRQKDLGFGGEESEGSVNFAEEEEEVVEFEQSIGDGGDEETSDDEDVIFVEEVDSCRNPLHSMKKEPVEEATGSSFVKELDSSRSPLHSVKKEPIEDDEKDVTFITKDAVRKAKCNSFVQKSVPRENPLPFAEEKMVDEEAKDEESGEKEQEEAIAMPYDHCVARRTRIQVGTQRRVSYAEYFKNTFSDYSEEEEKDEDDDEEEEDEEDEESTTTAGGKGENDEAILKKKKRYGIDILVSGSNEKTESERPISSGSAGVSQRTRSHFNSVREDKLKKVGTISNPYFIDVEDGKNEDAVGVGNRMEAHRRERSNAVKGNRMNVDGTEHKERRNDLNVDRMNVDEIERKEGSNASNGREVKETERGEVGTSKKRKRSQTLKDHELFKVLADAILNEGETLPEELVDSMSPAENESASRQEIVLPLLFSFGDDDTKPVEKTEYEKEIDQLWADFDFAMEAKNIGVYHDDEVQTEHIHVESDPAILCSKGKHQCILDEQIGIKCKFCSFVKLEIKYIFPSWASHVGERFFQEGNLNRVDPSLFNNPFTSVKVDKCQSSRGYSNGTIWDVIPGFAETMFPHQLEAFEFMWRNLAGSIHLDELKAGVGSDGTGGCVISHAPGTGKTRLTIVFIKSYMEVFPECRPVIVAPRGLMQTWQNEFKKWRADILIHNLNDQEYSNQEDNVYCNLGRSDMRLMRLVKLYSWDKGNSIILLSYKLFGTICSSNDAKNSQLKKILLEKPGLIIFDEGHTPRNARSQIWKTVEKIKTYKRVILSGTPFQNNFTELYNTLCLVRPKFAENISTRTAKLGQARRAEFFSSKVERFPEKNEARSWWDCLTKSVNPDSKELKTCIEEVKSIIEPFVHVHNGKILDTLPGLRKCILVLDPPQQQKIILKKVKEMKSNCSFNNDFRNSLVSIHPSLAMTFLSEKENSLMDTPLLEKVRLNPDEGAKTKFVIELVRLCEALNEKVLVFCQYIKPLDMMKNQLIKLFNWSEGREVLKMDGKIHTQHRQSLIDVFNDLSSEARVLLASTKACSEGISLVGASRVVLLDILWNPAMEYQAISRAHRIGQRKFVYIYQLITFGTGDSEKFSIQATKDKMSKLVFSPEINLDNIKASSSHCEEDQTSKLVAEDKILDEMTGHEIIKDMFRKIYYVPKESCIMYVFNEDDMIPANNGHL